MLSTVNSTLKSIKKSVMYDPWSLYCNSDIVEKPMQIKDFHLIIPDGIGFGVEINERQLDRFTRKS